MLVNREIEQNVTLKNTIRIKNKKRLKISLINRTEQARISSLKYKTPNPTPPQVGFCFHYFGSGIDGELGHILLIELLNLYL